MKEHLTKNWKWYAAGAVGVAILAYAAKADAADLGGSCCADLEERIAELEATTARKGNKRVSVTIAGQVNKSLYYFDAEDFGIPSDTKIIENGAAETFVSFNAHVVISNGAYAGGVVEIGQGTTGLDVNVAINPVPFGIAATGDIGTDNGLYTRQSFVYVGSKDLGTLSLGLQSMATDDLVKGGVARTDAAEKRLTFSPVSDITISVLGIQILNLPLEPFNGRKANSVKYTTPVWEGFSASAAWTSEDESFDARVSFARELAGFAVVASAGHYSDRDWDLIEPIGNLILLPDIEAKTTTLNGGVKHMVSGLFLQGSWAKLEVDMPALLGGASLDTDSYHLQGGWEGRVFEVGQTTLWLSYQEWSDLDLETVGVGVNQQLGDAVDLYGIAKRMETGVGDVDSFLGGLRLKF